MSEILNTRSGEDNSSIDDYTKWSILAEHGGTMGVREDPMERMGTRDEDYRDISGLLDAYSEKINDSGMGDIVLRDAHTESVIEDKDTHKPYKASEIINALKNELNKRENEETNQ